MKNRNEIQEDVTPLSQDDWDALWEIWDDPTNNHCRAARNLPPIRIPCFVMENPFKEEVDR